MAKFIERIALETYNYLEIHADDLGELTELSKFARNSADYKDRLHKEAKPIAPSPEPYPAGMQMSTSGKTCKVCNTEMKYKEGTAQSGKAWKGYFCPNSTKENNHPPEWVR